MKKNKFGTLVLIGLASAVMISSCKKDEDDAPKTTYGSIFMTEATLQGRNNPTPNGGEAFLNYSSGDAVTVATANSNQSDVDVAFYYGQSSENYYTLAAPDDAVFANTDVNANPWEQILTWTVKNGTRFKKLTGVTHAQIDDAENDSIILVHATGMTETDITKLKPGDAVAFQTAGGKKGIYAVEDTLGTNGITRAIEIHYIVQE
jgi:hypothetical protein